MNRTCQKSEAPSHERWLVSYADFITLLFALFVVLFAASNADRGKARQVARAVEAAIQGSGVRPHEQNLPSKTRQNSELNAAYDELLSSLQSEMTKTQVSVALEARGLVITLNQPAFFTSGSAEFDEAMYPTLEKIAAAIVRMRNPIRLEGHTDSRPIHNDRFRNNWELSAGRSIAVLELLTERFEVAPTRVAIAGFADTMPRSPNDTDEGRARNRRVEIVVLNRASQY